MMSEYGTLYGIGVGPGDPELITIKAVKILQRVACVFAAASPRNSHSLAEKAISPHLRKDTPVVRLNFPMTRDLSELKQAWEENAGKIMEVVGIGKDAAVIGIFKYQCRRFLLVQVVHLERLVFTPDETISHYGSGRFQGCTSHGLISLFFQKRKFFMSDVKTAGGMIENQPWLIDRTILATVDHIPVTITTI